MMIKAPDCPAGHPSCLILGDNIFHGQGLGDYLKGLLRRGWN
jgi:dTDP-glucose pyrophosphorylase